MSCFLTINFIWSVVNRIPNRKPQRTVKDVVRAGITMSIHETIVLNHKKDEVIIIAIYRLSVVTVRHINVC